MTHRPAAPALAAALAAALALLSAATGGGVPAAAQAGTRAAAAADSVTHAGPEEGDLPFGALTSFLMGMHLAERGDLPAALPYLEYAYRLAPADPQIADAYVTLLVDLGRPQDALAALQELGRVQPGNRRLRHQAIALLADARRWDDALAQVAAARAAGDDDPQLRLLEAEVLARAGRRAEAIDAYRRVAEASGWREEQAVLVLGALLRDAGREDELLAVWREALDATPDADRVRAAALRDLVRIGHDEDAVRLAAAGDSLAAVATGAGGEAAGNEAAAGGTWVQDAAGLLVQADRAGAAIRALNARRLAGGLGHAGWLTLARLLLHEDRWGEGIDLLRELLARAPDNARARLLLGESLANRGDVQEAEAQLRRAVALVPTEPEYLIALVRVLALRGARGGTAAAPGSPERDELERLTRQAGELVRPDDERGLLILGYTLRGLGDHAQAAAQFAAAARIPGVRREALLQQAICLEELRRYAEAREALEALRREHPDDPTVANSLGYFLAERGEELDRAQMLVREALSDQPDNPHYLDSLAWVAYKRGDLVSAFDLLVRAANAAPEEPEILEHLARTLLALNRPEDAAGVAQRALQAGGPPARLRALLEEIERARRAR